MKIVNSVTRQLDKHLIRQLIQETELVGMKEKEAVKYIEIKSGRPISIPSFYKHKRAMREEPDRNSWLNFYAKAGFIDHYRDRLKEMQMVQQDLMRMWIIETAKADKTMSEKYLIQHIAKNIRENNIVLSQLGVSMPVIASMKAMIDKSQSQEAIPYERILGDKTSREQSQEPRAESEFIV